MLLIDKKIELRKELYSLYKGINYMVAICQEKRQKLPVIYAVPVNNIYDYLLYKELLWFSYVINRYENL